MNKNKNKRAKRKFVVYVLYHYFNRTQDEIAEFIGVSQSTVSRDIKEADYEINIMKLTRELNQAYEFIISSHLLEQGKAKFYLKGEDLRQLD